ncbi:MAG: tyrosine-type recombinase/integrase [bacterium]|nr:tyrosine-type recombinase/integrase [bacterium]
MAARQRLTASFVATVDEPGTYGDGGHGSHGLMLRVRESKGGGVTKSWVQRLTINGRPTQVGLGPTWLVSLTEAREAAIDNHRIVRKGGDPRRAVGTPTFAEAVEQVIAMHSAGWKSGAGTAEAWQSQLARHATPLANKKVDRITPGDVLGVLQPIWLTLPEIAKKQRQRINAVMKWAIAKGYRDDNPAGDALAAALPKQNRGRHHRAVPAEEVASVIAAVRTSEAWQGTKLAFEFLALTACRSGEVRLATWGEIDWERRVWTIPAERTKTSVEHRVPLTDAALRVLEEAEQIANGSGLIFPSITGRAQNNSNMSKLLLDLNADMVPHGLRSSFRSWAAEATDYPREIAEMALGHTVGSRVERAYLRTDLFKKRARLMQDWADFLAQ